MKLNYDPQTGLIAGMRYCPSPHADARPEGMEPEVLVIHAISLPPGEFGGPAIEQLFTNCLDAGAHPYYVAIAGMEVSAHVLIRRDGELVQYVPLTARAWHAGVSAIEGRERVNDFSIGIELEGCDDRGFETVQYEQLAAVTREIMRAYPAITRERIYGHSDIAPGRKTDPGPMFDWSQYRSLLT